MHPLRLLILFDNLELSGSHRAALNLMASAPSVQIDCRLLICMSDKIGLSATDSRIVWPIAARRNSESLLAKMGKALTALRAATALARESDCILATCPPSSLIACWAAWRSGKPMVGWVHYDAEGRRRERVGATGGWLRDTLQNLLYYRLMPTLSLLVFVSDSTLKSMARERSGPIPEGWVSLPNIYTRSAFASHSATLPRLQAICQMGQPVLLVLGRLVRQKRWEDAIATAAALHALGVAAQWVFVGDGPEREVFLSSLAASPVRERLHWLGADPNPLPLLAEADALVMTSLYEAWPTVILEAFDLKVPVVAYDCPSGPAEMLGGGRRGWVSAEDPDAIAHALAELLSAAGAEEAGRRCEAGHAFLSGFEPAQAMPRWRAYLDRVASRCFEN